LPGETIHLGVFLRILPAHGIIEKRIEVDPIRMASRALVRKINFCARSIQAGNRWPV
jgi:hypothetical protein